MEKEIVCTICPIGCRILVKGNKEEISSVDGYSCKRGLEYAKAEFINPVRILTSTVKTKNALEPLLAVRSNRPVPKGKLFDCMKEIQAFVVEQPVKRYDVLIANICGTGCDIVAVANLN